MNDKLLDAYLALGFGQKITIRDKSYSYKDICKILNVDVLKYDIFEKFIISKLKGE